MTERMDVAELLKQLLHQERQYFPEHGETLEAPNVHGVYVIWSPHGEALHVGRTLCGKNGLKQRLRNHLHGASSFVKKSLAGKGARLRRGYQYQLLAVRSDRKRLLLEYAATVHLTPKHLGVGRPTKRKSKR